MRAEDISSYEDLQKYIKLELATQTIKRKTVQFQLTEEWFFKLDKLIRFALKHDQNEKGVIGIIDPTCKKLVMKINKVFTVVTRK